MKEDVEAYIRYYNHDRLHTANGNLSPINFEKVSIKSVQYDLTRTSYYLNGMLFC